MHFFFVEVEGGGQVDDLLLVPGRIGLVLGLQEIELLIVQADALLDHLLACHVVVCAVINCEVELLLQAVGGHHTVLLFPIESLDVPIHHFELPFKAAAVQYRCVCLLAEWLIPFMIYGCTCNTSRNAEGRVEFRLRAGLKGVHWHRWALLLQRQRG